MPPPFFMKFQESKRDKANRLLKELKKDYPHFNVLKTSGSNKIVITLPRKEVPVPVSSSQQKDYIQLDTIISLAQRLATTMVRETFDSLVDSVINKVSEGIVSELGDKLPAQQVIVREAADSIAKKTKESFKPDTNIVVPIDHQKGLELVGDTGKEFMKKDDLDRILKQLAAQQKK